MNFKLLELLQVGTMFAVSTPRHADLFKHGTRVIPHVLTAEECDR